MGRNVKVSRPHHWSHSIVGVGLMKYWSRSLIAVVEVSKSTQHTQPPAKKQIVLLFGRNRVTATQSTTSQDKTPAEDLTDCVDMIRITEMRFSEVFKMEQFSSIRPLLERVLHVSASSTPVERMFFPARSDYKTQLRQNV